MFLLPSILSYTGRICQEKKQGLLWKFINKTLAQAKNFDCGRMRHSFVKTHQFCIRIFGVLDIASGARDVI